MFLSSVWTYFFPAKNSFTSSEEKITKQPPNAAQEHCLIDMPQYQYYPTANHTGMHHAAGHPQMYQQQYQAPYILPVPHVPPPVYGSPSPMGRPGYEPSQLNANQFNQQLQNRYHNDQPYPPSPRVHETHQPAGYIETVPPPNIPQNCNNCTDVSERVRLMQLRFEEMEKNNRDLRNQVAKARDELNELRQLCHKSTTESRMVLEYLNHSFNGTPIFPGVHLPNEMQNPSSLARESDSTQQVPTEPPIISPNPQYQPENGYWQQPTQMGITELNEKEYQKCTADWPSSNNTNCGRVPTMAPLNQRRPVRQNSAIPVPIASTQNLNWTEIQL